MPQSLIALLVSIALLSVMISPPTRRMVRDVPVLPRDHELSLSPPDLAEWLASQTAVSPKELPAGSPSLVLDGYCAVTLKKQMVWRRGNFAFGAVHRGRTYLFASESFQKDFLADPDRYSPLLSGNDPYLVATTGKVVDGKRAFGFFYGDRLLLFSSHETMSKFQSAPEKFLADLRESLKPTGVRFE